MTILDGLILLSFLTAFFDGWRRGGLALILDFIGFGVGVGLAFLTFDNFGTWLGREFSFSSGLQPILAFTLILLIVPLALQAVFSFSLRFVPKIIRFGLNQRMVGAALGVIRHALNLFILINLLLFLPILPWVRSAIQQATLARPFVVHQPALEATFARIIEPAVKELQGAFTITEKSEVTAFNPKIPISELTVDEQAEREMFRLVNEARAQNNLTKLEWSEELANVGRIHSKDMWQRQYFSHLNPDGLDPFDRLTAADIFYLAAGENLALAPSTPIAHAGLMNSEGHRANILSPNYGRLGIGAVRNGLYGVMYSQEFSD
ncbi:CvpA family protein [Candidatus Berkelbacteria bacterium]|nr:CvpA family protein [Candidatus Berkelbacteria bacterium]